MIITICSTIYAVVERVLIIIPVLKHSNAKPNPNCIVCNTNTNLWVRIKTNKVTYLIRTLIPSEPYGSTKPVVFQEVLIVEKMWYTDIILIFVK